MLAAKPALAKPAEFEHALERLRLVDEWGVGGYIDVYRGHFGGVLVFGTVMAVTSLIIVLLAAPEHLARTTTRSAFAVEAASGLTTHGLTCRQDDHEKITPASRRAAE